MVTTADTPLDNTLRVSVFYPNGPSTAETCYFIRVVRRPMEDGRVVSLVTSLESVLDEAFIIILSALSPVFFFFFG